MSMMVLLISRRRQGTKDEVGGREECESALLRIKPTAPRWSATGPRCRPALALSSTFRISRNAG